MSGQEPVTDEEVAMLRSMEVRNGGVELTLETSQRVAQAIAGTARALLKDAPNHTEITWEFGDRQTFERYAMTFQRVGKLTPHEARKEAEVKASNAIRALDDLYAQLQQCARPDGSWPGADAAEIVRRVLANAGYDCE